MVLNVKFACNLTFKMGITKYNFKKPHYLKLILNDGPMTSLIIKWAEGRLKPD
tara:strand:+ start:109690 stop:109848 length:159 start_codon:yes stop_codon:yes gene_type:complete